MPDDAHAMIPLRVLISWYRSHYPLHCFYCGRALRKKKTRLHSQQRPNQLTEDHVTPRSCGGTNDNSNKVSCCHACNNLKDDLTLEGFRALVLDEPWLIGEKFFGERQYDKMQVR
jgi:5-methylcytosine-specific restriction endonuclease McrA